MSREKVVDLQRQIGNRGVLRLLALDRAVVQRQEEPAPGAGLILVGLKRGDGIHFGTEDKRERVSILQEKLNEKMLANLSLDGKFGQKTEEALKDFQESVEEPISGVVDPKTADLLMTEPAPPLPVEHVPAGEQAQVTKAGEELNPGGNEVQLVGAQLAFAGTQLAQTSGWGPAAAGALLQAGGMLASSGGELKKAATLMTTGTVAGVNEAGKSIGVAGKALLAGGTEIKRAGQHLGQEGGKAREVAKEGFTRFGAAAILAGHRLIAASVYLEFYRPPDAEGERIGDPIVGLKRGDGINFGTEDHRPRVKQLQELLNEKQGAGLEPDGKFGNLTTTALNEFQAKAEIPPAPRVDSATAKALRASGEAPGKEAREFLDNAGQRMAAAGGILVPAASELIWAGAGLMGGPTDQDRKAGEYVKDAKPHAVTAGDQIRKAGRSLSGQEETNP